MFWSKKNPPSLDFRRTRKKHVELSPDEIFLDSQNIPGFDQGQMEGRFERLLGRRVALLLFGVFVMIAGVVFIRLWDLQISRGDSFRARAFSNRMEQHSLIPERGVITDMYGKELAWNEPRFHVVINSSALRDSYDEITRILSRKEADLLYKKLEDVSVLSADVIIANGLTWDDANIFIAQEPHIPFRIEASSVRRYTTRRGFSHVIGYTGYADDENSSFLFLNSKVGKSGVEKYFDSILRGSTGVRLVELDAKGDIVSESIEDLPHNGASIALTIDAEMQSELYRILAGIADERGFQGGAGIVLDVRSGALRSVVSVPEFDANVFNEGLTEDAFALLENDPRAPFFFRAFEGRYIPGSAFKPVVALAALAEGIISPDKEIFSAGSISIPHPYIDGQFSIFRDWKAHGWTDMRRALAVSSDVYFYTIGGGYEGQKGVGAEKINKYAFLFGFGTPVFSGIINEEEGMVPDPREHDFWRVGDTYNFSIGQGGLEVTPLQMARFVSMIARNGSVPDIHFIQDPYELNRDITKNRLSGISLPQEYFRIIQEGMRLAVTQGTAQALSGLGVTIAGKTGTAEVGASKVNSWIIGYLPYDNPTIAFALVLERGNETNLVGAASGARELVGWIMRERPEYRGE
ncbi:MAG: hypothetical protein HY445_00255 [Candidatus Niyogibacteria bacterium]|nr:hypothetical protein [Candidatus Niyogibacteria bacterium]